MSDRLVILNPKQVKRRNLINIIFGIGTVAVAILSILPLFFVMTHIFKEGLSVIKPEFMVSLPKPVGEPGGGIANALVGSAILIAMSTVIAVPFGIITGVFLGENQKSKLAEFVRLSVEVLQGVPSIVLGLITYMWFVKPFGSFSALSGSIALAIMMLPMVVRTTEETVKLIPKSLKDASLALGAPYYVTILSVVIPSAISGILTGIVVSLARIAGETAPLLFTAFGSPYMSVSPLKPIASLPQLIFNYAISPYEDWHALAWGASIILIIFILSVNIIAKTITGKFTIK